VRYRDGILKALSPSQVGTILQYTRAGKITARRWRIWLLSRSISIFRCHRVHAGLEADIPLERQDAFVLVGGASKRHITGLTETAGPLVLAVAARRETVGVRAPLDAPRRSIPPQNLFALDTGCCSGGVLSALALPSFRLYQVKGWRRRKRSRRWILSLSEFTKAGEFE